ncbi:Hsp33 family molecular chaperone HslO [Lentilactobacillus laojiaonis]|uniref:Hsp33 family molecular chaperone HslO n=1 Tax=Lentilactobacillus laojiaonis TaxID=2883998 RepID=UPI001D0A1B4D|nr:Hsp33 family molecular chaperone HslO [Lentilactobacillus laojiaonis]UDM31911.1 Hsp33 family molecular chaperone HslO [Lentilactobacillus laojiaonis]
MKDYLVKTITKDNQFRAYAITAKETVNTAQKDHNTLSASSAALGRSIVASTLLASSLDKSGAIISTKINGGGPVGSIIVDSDSKGHVKGYIQNPQVHLPLNDHHKIDVGKAVGINGFLQVTKMLKGMEPTNSSVPLTSGEIGDDFTFYLAQSEQIPSAVGVSVFVNDDNTIGAAGGYFIQVLPGASDESITKLEERLRSLPMLSELLLADQTPEAILELIFGSDNLKVLEQIPVEFYCDCSKKQFGDDLTGLPIDQLETMLNEDHGVSVTCNFCESHYEYSEDELKEIIEIAKSKAND